MKMKIYRVKHDFGIFYSVYKNGKWIDNYKIWDLKKLIPDYRLYIEPGIYSQLPYLSFLTPLPAYPHSSLSLRPR